MLRSMTGFGLFHDEYNDQRITAEVKSLNSKFFELSLKLPRAHLHQEMALRAEALRFLERGKVSIVITIDTIKDQEVSMARVDHVLLKKYYSELLKSASELGASTENLFQICLGMPQVIIQNDESADPSEWAVILNTFKSAMEAACRFRAQEGKVLEGDISARIRIILEHLSIIEHTDQARLPLIREKIHNHLLQAVGSGLVDDNRLEQEMVYFVERLDITEEKIRLRSHCDYFLTNLAQSEPSGKKLGFISQEIGREINTIGSKVNDALIQQRIVLMKDELEKIKEQLLNIL